MTNRADFRFDLPVHGEGTAASPRFGTRKLSELSGFETLKTQRGYSGASGRLR
jgi:hypothetical protein